MIRWTKREETSVWFTPSCWVILFQLKVTDKLFENLRDAKKVKTWQNLRQVDKPVDVTLCTVLLKQKAGWQEYQYYIAFLRNLCTIIYEAMFTLSAQARLSPGHVYEHTVFSRSHSRIRARCPCPSTRSRPCTQALKWVFISWVPSVWTQQHFVPVPRH